MLTQLENSPKVVGAKQTKRAVRDGAAALVFLARDADPQITQPIAALCQEGGTQVEYVDSMARLGQACGIAVGAAVAALLR